MSNNCENRKVVNFSDIESELSEASEEYLEHPEETKERIEELLDTLVDVCMKLLKFDSNEVIKQDKANLEAYREIIKKDNISFEERKYIIGEMNKAIADIKREKSKMIAGAFIIVSGVILYVIAKKKISRHA